MENRRTLSFWIIRGIGERMQKNFWIDSCISLSSPIRLKKKTTKSSREILLDGLREEFERARRCKLRLLVQKILIVKREKKMEELIYSTKYMGDIDDFEESLEVLKYQARSVKNDNGFMYVGELGLWNGKKLTVKDMLYTDLEDIIKELIEHEWNDFELREDNDDLYIDLYHHDGINSFLIRAWKPNVTEKQKSKVINTIWEKGFEFGKKSELLEKYTVIVKYPLEGRRL